MFFLGMDKICAHEFDPRIAELYGVNAAIIFQHIAYLSQESTTRWVDLSLSELCAKYPYMGRKAIWLALQRLIIPGKKTPALVARKGRPMGIGHLYRPIPDNGFCDLPHKFNTALAADIGIVPAIIYWNVSYFIRKNWCERAQVLYEKLTPEEFNYDERAMQDFSFSHTNKAASHFGTVEHWIEYHKYVSCRSAYRGFDVLVRQGLLVRTYLPHSIPLWSLPAKNLAAFKRNRLECCELENPTAKRKSSVPKGNNHCQKETSAAKREQSDLHERTEDEGLTGNSSSVTEAVLSEGAAVPASQVKSSVKHSHNEFGSAERRREVLAEARLLNKPGRPAKAKPEKEDPSQWFKPKRAYKSQNEWADLNDQ